MVSASSGYLPAIQLDEDFDPVPVTAHLSGSPAASIDELRTDASPLTRALLIALLLSLVGIAAFQIVRWQSPPSSAFVQRMNEKAFESQVLKGEPEQLWIVNFWSPTRARCREFVPVFNATAEAMQDSASFASVRQENAREISSKLQVDLMPSVLAIRGGKEVDRLEGFQTQEEIAAFVEQYVDK
jgi:thiol-disulfide isomerase/thioredoxin